MYLIDNSPIMVRSLILRCFALSNQSILDECGLEENVKELLLTHIKRRLMPQAVKVRSDIEVGCYAYEGVDAVKNALRAGIACGTEDMPIKINLIAPPRYVVTTTTLDKEKGISLLNEALDKISESIKNSGGIFTVSTAVSFIMPPPLLWSHPLSVC